MKKRIICLLLAVITIFSLMPTACAAVYDPRLSSEQIAQKLYDLGLVKGVGTKADGTVNFDLDRKPTRYEGVTMLVRLLGKEEEALVGEWDIPFTDVVAWAAPYVGYAYANGLTSGTGTSTFSGNEIITYSQYLTFILRSLGYDSSKDFQWDKAWEFAYKIGLTPRSADGTLYRSGVMILSATALDLPMKNSTLTLLDTIFPKEDIPEVEDAPVTPAPADKVATNYDPILDTFKIPVGLGKPRYNKDEIQKMIDDDLSLNQVAQMIATYADLLQYLHMKGFGKVNGELPFVEGDMHFIYDGYEWSVNRNPQTVFKTNNGNCGGDSNLVNYILRDDYDSQGYVAETANLGGHIYNYFEVDGTYYFCDLTKFVHGGEWRTSYRIYSTDDPQAFSDYYIRDNHSRNSSISEKYLLLQYMYEYDGNHRALGNKLEGTSTTLGYPYAHVEQTEIKDSVRVLYVEEGYPSVEFVDGPSIGYWPKEAQ